MRVVKPGPDREVPRGVVGGAEISQASAGAQNIYMGVFRVPPGLASRAHYHEGCESAVYMLSGALAGPLGRPPGAAADARAAAISSMCRPRETHILENISDTEAAEYVVARDSPHEDAVVVPWAEEPRDRNSPRRRAARRRRAAHLLAGVERGRRAAERRRDRPRRRRAQRPLRPRRGAARRRRPRGLRHRPSRPRPLRRPAGADRPDGQRGRRPRRAGPSGRRRAPRHEAVPARPQHGRRGRAQLRDAPSGSPRRPDPDRPAGRARGRLAPGCGSWLGRSRRSRRGFPWSASTPRRSAATRPSSRPTRPIRSSTTASSPPARSPSWRRRSSRSRPASRRSPCRR